jgi:purine-binding chemotaxis protein CheW
MRTVPSRDGDAIDWQAVRDRLARAFVGTNEALEPSPERAREILEERARQLARPLVAPNRSDVAIRVLAFALGAENYAIEARYVQEVLPLTTCTSLPGAPDFVLGVANRRGAILAVYDLRRLFGLPAAGIADRSHVIVCDSSGAALGLLADRVLEVKELPPEELRPEPIFADERQRGTVRGLARDAMIILDGAALLSDRRLFVGRSDDPEARSLEGTD